MSWKAIWLVASACMSANAFDSRGPPTTRSLRLPADQARSYSNCTTIQPNTATGTATSHFDPRRPALASEPKSAPSLPGCDGRGTVNAINATVKWWYTTTDFVPASTVSIQYDTDDTSTGWTVFAATQTYDTATAIVTSSCSPPYTTGTYESTVYTLSLCDTDPIYVAATTSPLYREGFRSPTKTTGYKTEIPDLRVTPPPASVVLAHHTFRTGTPFVQFSEYEVVKSSSNRNGTCQAVTQSYRLAAPYGFKYTGPDPARVTNIDAAIIGKLDSAFPAYINRTNLVAGSYAGPPTVIIVVDRILVAVAVLAATARVESSASALALPGANLPPGFSQPPVTRPTQNTYTEKVYPTARVEVTQTWLLVPGRETSPEAQQITTDPPQPGPTQGQRPATTSACAIKDCPAAQPVVVAGETLKPQDVPAYVVGGKTAVKGGNAITVAGKTLSAMESGDSLLVWDGTTTKTVAAGTSGAFVIDGMQVTATSGLIYHGPSQTLVPGGSAVTINGISVSVAPGGGLQIGGQATTSGNGIATHIIDGIGGTSTTSSTSSTTGSSDGSTPGNYANSLASSQTALWLATGVAIGFAWFIG